MLEKFRKFLAVIVICVSVLGIAAFVQVPASAAQITDLDQCASFTRAAVEYLIREGIVEGHNGKFNPTDILTRAQLVKMLVDSMEIDISNPPEVPSFTDVASDHWSYPYIEAALKEGIIVMSPGRIFSPNQQATREQMSAMMVRALKITDEQLFLNQGLDALTNLTDAKQVSKWAWDSVEFSLDSGLMVGVGGGRFAPSLKAERQQAALVIYRFIMSQDRLSQLKEDFSKPVKYPEYYHALKSVIDKTRFHIYMDSFTAVRDLGSNQIHETVGGIQMNMDGVLNGLNTQVDAEGYVFLEGLGRVDFDYKIIALDGTLYFKESEDAEWMMLSEEELDGLSLPAVSTEEVLPLESGLLRNYNNQNIVKKKVFPNGRMHTLYSLEFNDRNYLQYGFDTIGDFMGTDGLDLGKEYDNGFSFNVELLVNEIQQITEFSVGFVGNTSDEANNLDINNVILIKISYSETGIDIPILAPEIN